jgi:hypothetical protein
MGSKPSKNPPPAPNLISFSAKKKKFTYNIENFSSSVNNNDVEMIITIIIILIMINIIIIYDIKSL